MRFWSIALVLALLMLPAVASATHRTVVERAYVGSHPAWPFNACDIGFDQPASFCIAVPAGDTRLSVVLTDRSGFAVPGEWWFYGGSSGCCGVSGIFCGTADVPIPTGAHEVAISLLPPGMGTYACRLPAVTPAVATAGTVRAVFT